jgi:hypothetical protein
MRDKMKAKKIGIGILCAMFIALLGTGIAGAQASVLGQYTSAYVPATCVLGVYSNPSTIDLTSATAGSPATLYVQNAGTSGTSISGASTPSSMAINVSFNDNGAGTSAGGGWYTGATWTPSGSWVDSLGYGSPMLTYWSSAIQTTQEQLYAESLLNPGTAVPYFTAYSSLPSVGPGGAWNPINFYVTAPATLPAGTYNQQIVISGSC